MTKQLFDIGRLETAYIDESAHENYKALAPAVFFVNATGTADAKRLLDQMPIVRSKRATYALHRVGRFLLGTSSNVQ
ncbi:hypothetical protein [Dyadobacter sp. 676]|uniref:Uncharacterized protein n=1 Tax=Dyadobacter sp. 676 TaxID=3088362 RepID=A0AAU8FHR6_9BACT